MKFKRIHSVCAATVGSSGCAFEAPVSEVGTAVRSLCFNVALRNDLKPAFDAVASGSR